MYSGEDNSVWTKKGGTLSDKSARKEFGITQEEIIDAIRGGKLQYGFGTKMPTDSGRFLRQIFQKMPPHSESQNNIVPRPCSTALIPGMGTHI